MFYIGPTRTNNEHRNKGVHAMNQIDAMTYLKEASALLGLLLIVYLWSLVAMALQV